jgi:hypothetical protein
MTCLLLLSPGDNPIAVNKYILYKNGLIQGDALSPMPFNYALDYAIRMVRVNQDGLKLNGTHQLWFMLMMLIYWEEGYILHKKTLVDSKQIGLEINADKTKYMVMSRDQNAGRSYSIKTDSSSFARVEQVRYLGTA